MYQTICMTKIKQLPPHEAQKIAAGQVVERPANIVKELIENALDAQATQISLYIEDGGKKLIRVIDNGYGMNSDDAQLCFAKHATSKITSVEQLETINTFGFRGEALASIAAVGKVTLLTKQSDTQQGTKIIIEGGHIKDHTITACKTGTDIAIHNLFYNIPARQKFLKKTQTEWRHIQQLFHAFCFAHPSIHFKLFSEDKPIYNYPTAQFDERESHTNNIISRCTQIWEHNQAQHMLAINAEHSNTLKITGAISNHQHYRYNRNGILFFVNKRWIKNYSLSSALLKGYLNVIPPGRYPMAIINITVDPTTVDINIHPRKEEVKFIHPRRVEQLIKNAIKEVLEENLSNQIKQPVDFVPQTKNFGFDVPHTSPSFAYPHQPTPPFAATPTKQEKKSTLPFEITHNKQFETKEYEQTIIQPQTPNINQTTSTTSYNLIGQYKKTYLLIEKETGLFLIDQHAAQERILYELFSTRFQDIATTKLIFPQIINTTQDNIQTLEPHLTIFHRNGIGIEQFGTNQLKIESTPVHLKGQSLEDLVQQVIAWIQEYQSLDSDKFFNTINEKLHAQMACKAAVKAGDVLTQEQMIQLLKDLEKTPNRFTCPHGRPTGWLLSINEIEKKFKRRL